MDVRKRIALGLMALPAILTVSAVIILSQRVEPVPAGLEPIRATAGAGDSGASATIIVENGMFRDEAARYYLKIPGGWVAGNYPGLFLSPDAEGLVGYADTRGMALMVDRSPKDAAVGVAEWLAQTGEERHLTRRLDALTVDGRPALLYEANWDTQGKAITAFVDDRDSVLRISCFHPTSGSGQACMDVMAELLPTAQLE